ncbi:glycoside hydrolase family 127 protein [Breznakiella homolactica]|uniref:Glycoside hydrolase family 127 protein n=1 Tax=Breznakiella homolactica TaxID=2798577 RepID=A0A7T7XKF5_9SPIR|nr:beta-L-arabinofuranosidase domain-containing protein [Breznakiella homolactica]QQO07828.1 glycoside hydrolase family 127 protein [Breznakiella homolactica]
MMRQYTPVNMKHVRLTSGLLAERQKLNTEITVPHIYHELDTTGRIDSLYCRWKPGDPNKPHPFWDSDIGKMIEAISYSLITNPSEDLEEKVDRIVDMLEQEQFPDGYLNTYFKTCEIKNRFTNLYYMHELYCAGHLIEGAVAYFEATGKRKFLDIMCRYVDLIDDTFGSEPGKKRGYCGHPEIELALVRLYGVTQNEKHLNLSKYFIDERGTQPYFFEQESLAYGVDTTKTANQKRHLKYYLKSRGPYAEYQSHLPVREQKEPVGHAVRAMYLYSGMSDIADAYDDVALYNACKTIWDAMANTQYAIIGGIGPSSDGERFTFAYDIPNEYTYNESCASVALAMWANRMVQFDCDSRYPDILEQTLYNVILASVDVLGNKFFYANYLSALPERFEHASAAVIDKMKAERQEWFDVACCPPNISRLMGSLGSYMYSVNETGLFMHLYAGCDAELRVKDTPVKLTVTTDYPWEGSVRIEVGASGGEVFTVGLRIPGWCRNWEVTVNGSDVPYEIRKGYCLIRRIWGNDTIELEFSMPVMQIEARPEVREACGRVALQRGPVIYCIEEADNGKDINNLCIPGECTFSESRGIELVDPRAVVLQFSGFKRNPGGWQDGLYREVRSTLEPAAIKAIPYYLWGNRGFGRMLVWMLRT